jgi:hypothetical protein
MTVRHNTVMRYVFKTLTDAQPQLYNMQGD